jgi:predicted DNA-binding protein
VSYYVVKLSPDAHASLKALRKKTGVTIAFMTRAAIDDYIAKVKLVLPVHRRKRKKGAI